MKILVDVMGGDNAPDAAVIGALDAGKIFFRYFGHNGGK